MTKREMAEFVASELEDLAREEAVNGVADLKVDELSYDMLDYIMDHEEAVMARLSAIESIKKATLSKDYSIIHIELKT